MIDWLLRVLSSALRPSAADPAAIVHIDMLGGAVMDAGQPLEQSFQPGERGLCLDRGEEQ